VKERKLSSACVAAGNSTNAAQDQTRPARTKANDVRIKSMYSVTTYLPTYLVCTIVFQPSPLA
jgi:hypothetical protein